MKKYFIASDIHSYYDEFMNALIKADYDVNNNDHILIICGDLFDRGTQSIQLYLFIRSLPKKRRILIRGNHEHLLLELIERGYPNDYDYSNGTYDTWCTFNKYNLLNSVKKWLKSAEWVNYYELSNYIFVHSFIPLKSKNDLIVDSFNIKSKYLKYNKNWRGANDLEWEEASWGCPWDRFKNGLFDKEIKNNKILVCGHWHTSDFYNNLKNENYSLKNNPIYYSDNLIALDACTVLTHGINILTIENNKTICYNYND